MEKMVCNKDVCNLNEGIIEELTKVENLLWATIESCLNKECNSEYYAENEGANNISAERNKYITILTIALEHLTHIKNLNGTLEDMIIKASLEKLKRKN